MARPTKDDNGTGASARGTGRFLVAGTAIDETVVHQPEGGSREGLGGVAATIALALAEARNHVTLVTNIGQGPEGRRAEELLVDTPIGVLARRSKSSAGHAVILTHRGEQRQANGRWPRQYGLSETVRSEAEDHDCIIADCNMTPRELAKVMDQPGKLTMVNGTTRGSTRILKANPKELGMLTVNEAEASAMMRAIHVSRRPTLMKRLNARTMLLTLGRKGLLAERKYLA